MDRSASFRSISWTNRKRAATQNRQLDQTRELEQRHDRERARHGEGVRTYYGPRQERLAAELRAIERRQRRGGGMYKLRQAAADGAVVCIVYRALSSDATTERDIEPWTVFSTMGNWYVSAHCRLATDERVFRIDRIQEAELTGDSFEPPAEPPPPVVSYSPGVDDVTAVLRLGPAAQWVTDYYPVDEVSSDETSTTVRFSASDPKVVARLLLRLGEAAELLEGREVADAAADLRRRILVRYSG